MIKFVNMKNVEFKNIKILLSEKRRFKFLVVVFILTIVVFNLSLKYNQTNRLRVDERLHCDEVYAKSARLHSTIAKNKPSTSRASSLAENFYNLKLKSEWILTNYFVSLTNSSRFKSKLYIENAWIERILDRIDRRQTYNSMGDFNLEQILRNVFSNVKDYTKRAGKMLITLLNVYNLEYVPWMETLVYDILTERNLSFSLTSVDYNEKSYENSNLFRHENLREHLLNGKYENSDLVIDYFASETWGLGLYGEEISIDADLQTTRQAWCMLKPGGVLVLAVSLSKMFDDKTNEPQSYIEFNTRRVYGPDRLKVLLEDRQWTQLDAVDFNHGSVRIFVLQKPNLY